MGEIFGKEAPRSENKKRLLSEEPGLWVRGDYKSGRGVPKPQYDSGSGVPKPRKARFFIRSGFQARTKIPGSFGTISGRGVPTSRTIPPNWILIKEALRSDVQKWLLSAASGFWSPRPKDWESDSYFETLVAKRSVPE